MSHHTSLILIFASFFICGQLLSQPIPFFNELVPLHFPLKGRSIQVTINNECLANSNARYNAKFTLYFRDGTKECIYLDRATSRNNSQLIFLATDIPTHLGFNLNFKVAIVYSDQRACTIYSECGDRLPECCMTPELFDCCMCGAWEEDLETFWFDYTNSVPASEESYFYSINSDPNRIPGFTSPMQINSIEYGCQCCNY